MTLKRRKDDRRARILAAAEQLIRETGSTDFSMNALAERAGSSTPTTYNLIGSKATVLYTLLNNYQDNIDIRSVLKRRSREPFRNVIRAVDLAVGVYTADSPFIKPLMRFLIGAVEPEHRSLFMQRGYRYWYGALEGFVEAGLLTDQSRRILAKDFVIYFTGLIDFWLQGELSDPLFLAMARYGSFARLVHLHPADDREQLAVTQNRYEGDIARWGGIER